ncbi:MAG: CsbD family protein [Kofleriaceae bacterium]|nr:CsbD family protein [Kofleriaceae bacterium]
MKWEQMEGNWTEVKASVRATFSKLTDADIEQIEGKKERLIGRIQRRYGYPKEKAEKEANELISRL